MTLDSKHTFYISNGSCFDKWTVELRRVGDTSDIFISRNDVNMHVEAEHYYKQRVSSEKLEILEKIKFAQWLAMNYNIEELTPKEGIQAYKHYRKENDKDDLFD